MYINELKKREEREGSGENILLSENYFYFKFFIGFICFAILVSQFNSLQMP